MRCLTALTVLLVLLLAAAAPAQVQRWGSYGKGGEATASPTTIPGVEDVTAIDAQNQASYMLESNGTLWAVGEGKTGELGDGLTEQDFGAAVQVGFPSGTEIVAIGEARSAGYAIDSHGHGWAWGKAFEGSLCLGGVDEEVVLTPREVTIEDVKAVQGGSDHVLWLMSNGTVEACGLNKDGELGTGPHIKRSDTPVPVVGIPERVVEISAGQASSCARTEAGDVYDWGGDANGQVGNGVEEKAVYEPFHVPLPGPASEVSCGGNVSKNGHTHALVEGVLYGWGADSDGQIGDDDTSNKPYPTPATTPILFSHVIASGEFSLGLTPTGEVYAWGSNTDETLATGMVRKAPKLSLTPLLVSTGQVEISSTAYNAMER